MKNNNFYAVENVRRRPLWKRVDCPTCGRKKGQNCSLSFKESLFNTFICEARLLEAQKLKELPK